MQHLAIRNAGVVVTGGSTGIGYATALLLARSGFSVFAGVRTPGDEAALRGAHDRIRPIFLDVTQSGDVSAAVQVVTGSGIPLAGIVNNAGVAVAGPLEFLPLADLRRQFDVNFFGSLAVTQAFLPLLRLFVGRIVFMSSVSGQIAAPFVGAYSSSKFAIEAASDALRMELAPWNIRVSTVEPGNVRTPIWQKGRDAKDAMIASMSPQASDFYAAQLENVARITLREEQTGIEPDVVARAVLLALTTKVPRARYAVGGPPGWQRRIAALLPERIRDRLILRAMSR